MTRLVDICLTYTFFSFDGDFYEKTCGVAMASPLSLVVANIFREDFESNALASSHLLPNLWKRFVDDTCFIWSHGKEELDLFFLHLNNQSSSIKFTMEYEINGSLIFLDALLSRNDDGFFPIKSFRRKLTRRNIFMVNLIISRHKSLVFSKL